jgi:hypothetical protein
MWSRILTSVILRMDEAQLTWGRNQDADADVDVFREEVDKAWDEGRSRHAMHEIEHALEDAANATILAEHRNQKDALSAKISVLLPFYLFVCRPLYRCGLSTVVCRTSILVLPP